MEKSEQLIQSDGKCNIKRIKRILKLTNEYPSEYRKLIWKLLLKIPENYSAFCTFVNNGIHLKLFKFLENDQPFDKNLSSNFQRILSAIIYCFPDYDKIEVLFNILRPFIENFHSNLHACFELSGTVLVNWFHLLLTNYPDYSLDYLDSINKLLEYHEKCLYSHIMACDFSAKDFVHLLIETAFHTVFDKSDWLKCWDHIVSNHPSYFLSVLIAFIAKNGDKLMSFSDKQQFTAYLSEKADVDIDSVIKEAYRLHKCTPSAIHPRNIYPNFTPLPADYDSLPMKIYAASQNQADIPEQLRKEEFEYLNDISIHKFHPSPLHRNKKFNCIHKNMLSSVKERLEQECHNEKCKIAAHEQRLMALHHEYLENETELRKLCSNKVSTLETLKPMAKCPADGNLNNVKTIASSTLCNCHFVTPLPMDEMENKISEIKIKSDKLKDDVSKLTDEISKTKPKELVDLNLEFSTKDFGSAELCSRDLGRDVILKLSKIQELRIERGLKKLNSS